MALERGPVTGPGLLLELQRTRAATLHEQIELALRDQVRRGRLAPGTRLPSSRALASELGVSRGVVLEAYAQLTAEGYLTASQGAPTRVAVLASGERERPPIAASSPARRHAYDFDPGVPDLAAFPRAEWLRAVRAVLRAAPFDSLGQGDPRGAPELRNTLMEYLGRVRGAAPEPEHTIVCAGFTQGFAVLCRALRQRGVERIAIEAPGWRQHRLIAEAAGLEPVEIAVDEQGLSIDVLAASGCEVVVVTPAHQFPTGVVLSPERRTALLEWAEDEDALIVEDDYDSELRYDRDAVGALQGLAPERTAYIGSASKLLGPGLRLGWVLSPSWLTGALTYEKAIADGGSPALEQLALADYITRGEFDRHLRRMRLRYRARRETLVRALSAQLPQARVGGVAAGLFVPVTLVGLDERPLAAAGVGADVVANDASRGESMLALGFGNLSERAIVDGVAALRDAAYG
jgi:GntR family transcriptional regulator / MocR family aminotransferase